MIESKFIKEFLIISHIYRAMNNILKSKLYKHNIPLNETQIVLLFLMNDHNILTGEEMLKLGHFSTSNLLFNINTLLSNNFAVNEVPNSIDNQLDMSLNLSKNGLNILKDIDKIFKNVSTNSDETTLNLLAKYEQNLTKIKI